MSWSDLFWIILILIVLFGCSTTEKTTRNENALKPLNIAELNTGTPRSQIDNKPHTFKYETVRSATSQQFVIEGTEPPVTPPQRALTLDLTKKAKSSVFTLYFPLDSWKIGKDKYRIIQQFIRSNRPKEVDVIGYTCWIGSKKHNQWLALRRAKEVAAYLKRSGVKVRSVKGKGKCCYIDRKNPAPNRRAEVKVVPPDADLVPSAGSGHRPPEADLRPMMGDRT